MLLGVEGIHADGGRVWEDWQREIEKDRQFKCIACEMICVGNSWLSEGTQKDVDRHDYQCHAAWTMRNIFLEGCRN